MSKIVCAVSTEGLLILSCEHFESVKGSQSLTKPRICDSCAAIATVRIARLFGDE